MGCAGARPTPTPSRRNMIGRGVGDPDAAAGDETVPWNGHEPHVRPNEVLSGDELSELFVADLRDGELPDGYGRREIQL
jgi:hypothetical protein